MCFLVSFDRLGSGDGVFVDKVIAFWFLSVWGALSVGVEYVWCEGVYGVADVYFACDVDLCSGFEYEPEPLWDYDGVLCSGVELDEGLVCSCCVEGCDDGGLVVLLEGDCEDGEE